jgi:hypothetical protein
VRFVRNDSNDWNIFDDIIKPIPENEDSVVKLLDVGNGSVGVIISWLTEGIPPSWNGLTLELMGNGVVEIYLFRRCIMLRVFEILVDFVYLSTLHAFQARHSLFWI